VRLDDLMGQSGEWLRGSGPESDIVISSRVRLARNLARFPFLTRATEEQRGEIHEAIRAALDKRGLAENGHCYVDLGRESSELTSRFLLERHLISRELANGEGGRGVLFNRSEMLSVMVNEEDHLRLQAIRAGFQVEEAYEDLRPIDDRLDRELGFAFSDDFGYLTACPTNVGTGMRASVMFHLPALVFTKQIDKVFAGVTKINLAVRGFYGEGTQASGDFFQISNQITLGISEGDILNALGRIVPKIVAYEREVRTHLLDKDRHAPSGQGPIAPRGQDLARARDVAGRPQHLVRGDDGSAVVGASRRESGTPVRRGYRDSQRALHPDPAGAPAKAGEA